MNSKGTESVPVLTQGGLTLRFRSDWRKKWRGLDIRSEFEGVKFVHTLELFEVQFAMKVEQALGFQRIIKPPMMGEFSRLKNSVRVSGNFGMGRTRKGFTLPKKPLRGSQEREQ